MIVCYLVSLVVLWIFHRAPQWTSSTYSEDITGDTWSDRVARWLALRKHEPSLLVDVLAAAIPFALIYVSTSVNVSPNSDWNRDDLVIAGFVSIGFSLLVIFGLGANIAINPQWSRSYPLIAIYFASITIAFAKLYVLRGMVDGGRSTADYYTGLYLSLITIANLGSGDVVPSVESRFVAVTESLIGYVALAFLAALLFTTMQRGMRSQIKAYNRRRRALAKAILPSSTSTS